MCSKLNVLKFTIKLLPVHNLCVQLKEISRVVSALGKKENSDYIREIGEWWLL
jgi:hypothetical protein